jgi:ferredoxin
MDAVRDYSHRPGGRDGASVEGEVQARVRVWIDQDLCTGDGLCTDHAPSVFTILEDGIAYCMEDGQTLNDPGGPAQLAVVPSSQEENVIHAAAECPGECIFIELHEAPAIEP